MLLNVLIDAGVQLPSLQKYPDEYPEMERNLGKTMVGIKFNKIIIKMAKKLLTSDAELVTKVENVLRTNKVPCARVQLHREQDKGKYLLVTINRYGEQMRKAIEENKTSDSKYYFGVLHNHPEYTVPRGILHELSTVKL